MKFHYYFLIKLQVRKKRWPITQKSCTGAKKYVLLKSTSIYVCSFSFPPPGVFIAHNMSRTVRPTGHSKASLTFRLPQCLKKTKKKNVEGWGNLLFWEKRKHESGTKAVIKGASNACSDGSRKCCRVPGGAPWLHFACVSGAGVQAHSQSPLLLLQLALTLCC